MTFGSGLVFTGVTLALSLVTTPLLLRWLGGERLGAFRALTDWFGYLALLELGFGGALRPLLARELARGTEDGIRALLEAGLRVYLRVTAAALAAGLVLVAVIPALVRVGPGSVADLRSAALLMLGGALLMVLNPFTILRQSAQREYHVNVLLVVQAVLVSGLALAFARLGWGITGQAAAAFCGLLVFYAAINRRNLPMIASLLRSVAKGGGRGDAMREIRSLSGPTLWRQVAGRVSFLSDNLVIAGLLGPASVVPFFVTRRLADLAQGQLQSVGNSTWAAMAELHARGDLQTFNRRLAGLTHGLCAAAVAVLVPIAVWTEDFVRLWIGSEQFAGRAVVLAAACAAFLLPLAALWDWALSATGRVRQLVPMSLVSAALNVGLSLFLTYRIGLAGPVLATALSLAAVNLWWLPLHLRSAYGTSVRRLAWNVARPLALGIPYAAVLAWVARSYPPPGLVVLAVEAGIATVVYAVGYYLLLHRSVPSLRSGLAGFFRHGEG